MTGSAAAVESDLALDVDDVSLTYPARRKQPARYALRGVSLQITPGQFVGLLGPNGCGKSSLIRIIAQLLAPDRGSAYVFGAAQPQMIRQSIGVVFQSPGLDRHLTVWENLSDQARLYGRSAADAAQLVESQLHAAGLHDRRNSLVKTLSGGLARRVDLCRAWMHRPSLLLLDEPTAGLDPSAREQFLRMLENEMREHGMTVLMTTHLTDEADRCDRVVLMHEGHIVADDSPAALREQLGSRRITVQAERNTKHCSDLRWTRIAGGFSAPLPDDPDRAGQAAASLARHNVSFAIAPPTLADVFEHLTGASLQESNA